MNQKTIERVPTYGENDVDLRVATAERRAVDQPASVAPQPVAAAQAVKYRFVTFNGPAVNAAGMNLKYNDNGTITAWPITDLSITKDAP